MKRDEAKYILRGYHLGGADAVDPQFSNALELLKNDPELASWFAEEQALDNKLSDRFRTFPVPPDLKGQLLAACKVVPLRAWWWRPVWIAAAACMGLLGLLAILQTRAPDQRPFIEYRSYIAHTAAKLDHLDFKTSDLAQIREWLAGHSAPEDFILPPKLNQDSSLGCRVFTWNRQKVSLVCFKLQNNKVAHVFVMDCSALTNLPGGNAPQFQKTGDGIATASWSDARRIYVIAMEQGEQDLKRLLL